MKLTQLASKPQLVKVEIKDDETLAIYGEPVEFYVYDRQPMDVFVKLATLDYTNFGSLTDIVKELVLDEDGKPIVRGDNVLPTDVLMKAINLVIETVGKSVSPTTTPQTVASK
jgi:hypothetical protein